MDGYLARSILTQSTNEVVAIMRRTVPSTDDNLDPILEGAEIKFVSVTVDSWTDFDSDTSTTRQSAHYRC